MKMHIKNYASTFLTLFGFMWIINCANGKFLKIKLKIQSAY